MRILLIEDDPIISMQMNDLLAKNGKVTIASSYEEAIDILSHQFFEIAFVDVNLGHSEYTGVNLLKHARSKVQKIYMLTSQDDELTVSRSLNKQADGFLSKNTDIKILRQEITNLIIGANSDKNLHQIFQKFPTNTASLKKHIQQLANSPSLFHLNLLFTGETGTGKTHLARTLCQVIFPELKFINLNLAEIAPNLIESELFGHVAGSFTGATKEHKGIFHEAKGQILFLDEIGSLPVESQVKLLKVIEEKRFKPVGSEHYQNCDFILITATCEDLELKIKNGDFREDFYFRIAGHHIHLPSLQQRKQDIEIIVKAWERQSPLKLNIDSKFIESLSHRHWPGNTRELFQFLRKRAYLGKTQCHDSERGLKAEKPESNTDNNNDWNLQEVEKLGLKNYVQQIEYEIFNTYLKKHHNKVNQICRKLKLSKAVYYRLAKAPHSEISLNF